MSDFGHRSKPAQGAGESNHASLLETALIPLAEHADDAVIAKRDVKVGEIEITPAFSRQKFFAGVKWGELLSRVVAVQAIDNLGEQSEAAACDVATCFEGALRAPDIYAGTIEAAHRMIGGKSGAARRKHRQGARVFGKDGGGVQRGATVGMEVLQETISTDEQAAAAIFRVEPQIAEVTKLGGLSVYKCPSHGAGSNADDFIFFKVSDGDCLVERATNFRAGEKVGFTFEGDLDVARNGIVDQEGAELSIIPALSQREGKLRNRAASLCRGYDSRPPCSTIDP